MEARDRVLRVIQWGLALYFLWYLCWVLIAYTIGQVQSYTLEQLHSESFVHTSVIPRNLIVLSGDVFFWGLVISPVVVATMLLIEVMKHGWDWKHSIHSLALLGCYLLFLTFALSEVGTRVGSWLMS